MDQGGERANHEGVLLKHVIARHGFHHSMRTEDYETSKATLDIQRLPVLDAFFSAHVIKLNIEGALEAVNNRALRDPSRGELKSKVARDFHRRTGLSRYYQLQRTLLLARSLSGVAESHGVLCGLLCSRVTPSTQSWFAHVLGHETGNCPPKTCDLLTRIAEETERAMDDADASFLPLLPDDDEPVSERAAALVEWCEGFLFGFGMNGSTDLSELSQEGREFVCDLKEMTRMNVLSLEDDEKSEVALSELVEYLKVGTLILREEVCAPKPETDRLH